MAVALLEPHIGTLRAEKRVSQTFPSPRGWRKEPARPVFPRSLSSRPGSARNAGPSAWDRTVEQGKAFALPLPRLHGQSEAIFNLALSFPLQRRLNGFPLAHGSTGSTDVVSHCDGKGYRVRNKSEIIRWHSWDQNSCLLPALTLSQRKEGSGYRLSRSRAHVPTLQRANTGAGCEQKQNEAPLPLRQIKDNLVHKVPKLPSLPSSHRASHEHHSATAQQRSSSASC